MGRVCVCMCLTRLEREWMMRFVCLLRIWEMMMQRQEIDGDEQTQGGLYRCRSSRTRGPLSIIPRRVILLSHSSPLIIFFLHAVCLERPCRYEREESGFRLRYTLKLCGVEETPRWSSSAPWRESSFQWGSSRSSGKPTRCFLQLIRALFLLPGVRRKGKASNKLELKMLFGVSPGD